jgi:hypothetical protein
MSELPGARAPASIALRVNGALKPPLHEKAMFIREVGANLPKETYEVLNNQWEV